MPVPPPEEDIPLPEPPPEEAMDPFRLTEEIRRKALESLPAVHAKGKKPGKEKGKTVIFGKREIKGTPVSMAALALDMGTVIVEGDVFAVNHRELKKRGAWVVSFDVTDYTGSVRVSKFFLGEEGKPLVDGVSVGQHLLIQGRLNLDRYTGDMVLEPYAVQLGEKITRKDTAEEKRVELHLHTTIDRKSTRLNSSHL